MKICVKPLKSHTLLSEDDPPDGMEPQAPLPLRNRSRTKISEGMALKAMRHGIEGIVA